MKIILDKITVYLLYYIYNNYKRCDMFISIDFNSETPIYEQIKRQIVIGIYKGSLNEGDTLPSVRQLGVDIGVNLHTVNKAYKELQAMGYVVMDRRVGTMINTAMPKLNEDDLNSFKSEMEYLISDWFNRGGSKAKLMEFINKLEQ